jgi:hypothetical protein
MGDECGVFAGKSEGTRPVERSKRRCRIILK